MAGLTLLCPCKLADMGALDPDDPRPPYRQIADRLRSAIEAGDFAPGEQLPALPVLMAQYNVSLGTVRSALNSLRESGLIVTRQGKGSYVRTRIQEADDKIGVKLGELQESVAALVKRVDEIERRLAGQ